MQTNCCKQCYGMGDCRGTKRDCDCHFPAPPEEWEEVWDANVSKTGYFMALTPARAKEFKAFIAETVAQAEARGAAEFYKNLQTRLPEMLEEKGGEFETYLLQVKAMGAAEAFKKAIELSDHIEAEHETTFDEWRGFKHFRNALRDLLSEKVDN